MRHHITIAALGATLLALTGCAGQTQPASAERQNSARPTAASSIASRDLTLPGASTTQARNAIAKYARDIHGPELVYILVKHSETADRYVCRARWYKDAEAYRKHTNTEPWPDAWPHLAVNCP